MSSQSFTDAALSGRRIGNRGQITALATNFYHKDTKKHKDLQFHVFVSLCIFVATKKGFSNRLQYKRHLLLLRLFRQKSNVKMR